MTLVNLHDALCMASNGGYAIGAFNLTGEDILFGILEAAALEKSPVIVSIAEAHLPLLHWPAFMKMVCAAAEAAPVPVVIHLDHSSRLETIYKAFQLGFTSVMYDGSACEFNENVSNTRHVCSIAHPLGISVEAELGHIGGVTDEITDEVEAHLTNPDLVHEFVERTNVDALAISFGTAHGIYVRQPELNFDLLAEIHRRIPTPLVLHGGSGLPDDAFLRSIQLGIRKINFGTELFAISTKEALRVLQDNPQLILYAEIGQAVRQVVKRRISQNMQLWGSSGKAW
jgi:fructose-bisphosphate aldolase, class II